MKILGERLFELRKSRKLTRQMVSEAISISAKSYERYENDERDPVAPVIVALADYFGVSTDYLLGRTDEP